jgi:hypothetical protein
MFASSQFPMPAARRCVEVASAPPQGGEGRDCEECRKATAELVLPQGRPGGWLLLLAACCALVIVTVALQAA